MSSIEQIQKAVDHYNERLDGTMVDGAPIWEAYGVTRKIAQAACSYGGYIVTGTRHYCPVMGMQIDAIGAEHLVQFAGGRDKIIQGFTCQYGHFLTREEAYHIALAAGQVLPTHEWGERLYSESYI